MQSEDLKRLETLLKKQQKGERFIKISNVECKPAVGKGENNGSEMVRAKIHVILASGQVTTRSLIIKRVPKFTQAQIEIFKRLPVFQTEIDVYTHVFPEMEKLMEQFGDTRGNLWAEFIGNIGTDEIILEDLKESGFKNVDRMKSLDLIHSSMAVKGIARFHAMSYALKQQNKLSISRFDKYYIVEDNIVCAKFYKGALNSLIEIMRISWDSSWIPITNKLEILSNNFGERLKKLVERVENRFNVLNHGDCWTNNIMFKYDPESSDPVDLRFVDLQGSHYNSFSWDLASFFRISIQQEVRQKYLDYLLQIYRDTLVETLEKFGSDCGCAPSLEEMKSEISRLDLFALLQVVSLLPIILAPPKNAINIGRLLEDSPDVAILHTDNLYENEICRDIIMEELRYFERKGVL